MKLKYLKQPFHKCFLQLSDILQLDKSYSETQKKRRKKTPWNLPVQRKKDNLTDRRSGGWEDKNEQHTYLSEELF